LDPEPHPLADEDLIGQAASHGCIRMRNADVVDLFDRVLPGALVHIG
jgi:L,D-transpeptidase YbiS